MKCESILAENNNQGLHVCYSSSCFFNIHVLTGISINRSIAELFRYLNIHVLTGSIVELFRYLNIHVFTGSIVELFRYLNIHVLTGSIVELFRYLNIHIYMY